MNYLLLPDLLAMSLLVSVLMFSGRREQDEMRLWTAGLLLILLECAARIVYTTKSGIVLHRISHVVALDAYLVAGIMFLLSAYPSLRRMPRRTAFLCIVVSPAFALLTLYGSDLRTAALYQLSVAAGLLAGVAACRVFRRRWTHYAAIAGVWFPLGFYVSTAHYRMAVYLSLCFLYLMCAVAFAGTLPSRSRGKIAVVAGFFVWSICFLVHPWVAEVHPGWNDFLDELWTMQKFIITIGFLLVLLERQVISTHWMALHDELTGLPNRRLFDDRLQSALQQAGREGRHVAIFNLDLDGFKQINDTYGHDAGDLLLKSIGRNLRQAVRSTDTLARLGGDEFSLIALSQANADGQRMSPTALLSQAEEISAAMMAAVEIPVELGPTFGDVVVQVSASVGVAFFPDDSSDAAGLMRLADHRMYGQKRERARLREGTDKPPLTLRTA
jgi:diguanylate cyclase (GGDEF)-like protein